MATSTNALLMGTRGKVAGLVVYQDGGQTIIREHIVHPKSETNEQVRTRAFHKELGRQWHEAGGFAQAAWHALCPRVPRWDANTGAGMTPYPSGYHLFGVPSVSGGGDGAGRPAFADVR